MNFSNVKVVLVIKIDRSKFVMAKFQIQKHIKMNFLIKAFVLVIGGGAVRYLTSTTKT